MTRRSESASMLWLSAWIFALILAGWLTSSVVKISTDLTAFLPSAQGDAETLLLDELQDGAAARLILVAIEGANPKQLAEISRSLAETLRPSPLFRQVENGVSTQSDALLETLRSSRYLLSANVTAAHFEADALRTALTARLNELSSPMSVLFGDWLPSDPTGELMAILQAWQPAQRPEMFDGVWLRQSPPRALLLLETTAFGFDTEAQQLVVAAIHAAFEPFAPIAQLHLTGPGPFSVLLQTHTQTEAALFGSLASLLMIVVLYWAYRSWRMVLLGALPLATAAVFGMLAVQLVYDEVHGITLAFGMTLIGVANDYPLHLFSHLHPGYPPERVARRIWPVLRLSVLATSIAYLTLMLADFAGLAQLGLFTVIALLVAAICTRLFVPRLLPCDARDCAPGWADRARRHIDRWPVWGWPAVLLVGISSVALWQSPKPLWDDALSGLTPVPKPLQQLDTELRQTLGAPDLRYLVTIRSSSAEMALQHSEALSHVLDQSVAAQELGSYDMAARYLPSVATQKARQHALPDAAHLREALQQAQSGLPFQLEIFEPFIADIERARQQPPLTPDSVKDSLIGFRTSPLLFERRGAWLALITLQHVAQPNALSQRIEASNLPQVRLFDLKAESEGMVTRFRESALLRILLAVVATLAVMLWGLPFRRVLPVLLPYAAAVLTVAALFQSLGMPLNLFHLVSLMLVAGVSMDYALFLGEPTLDPAERARSLHAVTLCLISTVSVFGILGLSEIPVLRAIGSTVTLGVVLSFVLALLGARPRESANTAHPT